MYFFVLKAIQFKQIYHEFLNLNLKNIIQAQKTVPKKLGPPTDSSKLQINWDILSNLCGLHRKPDLYQCKLISIFNFRVGIQRPSKMNIT